MVQVVRGPVRVQLRGVDEGSGVGDGELHARRVGEALVHGQGHRLAGRGGEGQVQGGPGDAEHRGHDREGEHRGDHDRVPGLALVAAAIGVGQDTAHVERPVGRARPSWPGSAAPTRRRPP
nr:hypothetical protein [Streptomyces sasae]